MLGLKLASRCSTPGTGSKRLNFCFPGFTAMASVWKHVAAPSSALCDTRVCTSDRPSSTENMLKEQVLQLQSALEEMRNLLNHAQMMSQELRAKKKERRRTQLSSQDQRNARQTCAALLEALLADRMRLADQVQEMKCQFQAQGSELEQAHAELEKVKAELHGRQIHVNASRGSEKELLGALMEHASHVLTAREAASEGSDQKLPQELDVVQAQKPVKEWQSAKTELPIQIAAREAAELRQELEDLQHKREHEEAVNKLQHASFIRFYNRHTAFEAGVTYFLQPLGQRHPDLACDFASTCGDAHAS